MIKRFLRPNKLKPDKLGKTLSIEFGNLKHRVNLLKKASEISILMIDRMQIEPNMLSYFLVSDARKPIVGRFNREREVKEERIFVTRVRQQGLFNSKTFIHPSDGRSEGIKNQNSEKDLLHPLIIK